MCISEMSEIWATFWTILICARIRHSVMHMKSIKVCCVSIYVILENHCENQVHSLLIEMLDAAGSQGYP